MLGFSCNGSTRVKNSTHLDVDPFLKSSVIMKSLVAIEKIVSSGTSTVSLQARVIDIPLSQKLLECTASFLCARAAFRNGDGKSFSTRT